MLYVHGLLYFAISLDADLSVRQFNVTFETEVHLLSVSLEVFDDEISEQEEKFILYTNYTTPTSVNDRCAIVVTIMDDDSELTTYIGKINDNYILRKFAGLLFNFSTNQDLIIREDVNIYSNLSIVKSGQNEPNVTVDIETLDLSGTTSALFE